MANTIALRMSNFPTPSYKIEENEQSVYPPSEDTFLLMDALEKDRELLMSMKPSLSVEIGAGSGVVTIFLHKLLSGDGTSSGQNTSSSSDSSLFSICTDLNKKALICTQRTANMNSVPARRIALLHCNALNPLLSRLNNSVDILLMNPPYVPTEEDAKVEEELSYAGGPQGRQLLDEIIPHVAAILSPKGCFYLVALKENGVDELLSSETRKKCNLSAETVLTRKCRNESLFVIRFSRCEAQSMEKTKSKSPLLSPASKQPAASSVTKITLHLKPVGAAPQLKKEFTKLKVDPNWTIAHLQQMVRKMLGIKSSDSLYIFVKEAFAANPEHLVGTLNQCFGSESGVLYLQYSLTPAWG